MQTRSNINQPPPIPPRQRLPSMFLQPSNQPGLQIQHVLEAHQRNPKKEVHESLLKSKNKLGNQTKAPNSFPCFGQDTSQEITSPKIREIRNCFQSGDFRKIETAQINLSDSSNTSQNLLPAL